MAIQPHENRTNHALQQRKTYQRTVDRNSPVSLLPAEILNLIFALLPVKDYKGALRVCGYWNQTAHNAPHWQRFKQHARQLAHLFSHLSLSDQKKELDKGNARLMHVLERGDQCRMLFQRVPVPCFPPQVLKLYTEAKSHPQQCDLKDRYMLCRRRPEGLGLLDLETNTVVPLHLTKYVRFKSDSPDPTVEQTPIKQITQLARLGERYVAMKVKPINENREQISIWDAEKRVCHEATFGPIVSGSTQIIDFSLSRFKIRRPPSGEEIVVSSICHLRDGHVDSLIYSIYRIVLATHQIFILKEIRVEDGVTEAIPQTYVHDQFIAINTVELEDVQPLTVLSHGDVVSHLKTPGCQIERIVGELDGTFFTSCYVDNVGRDGLNEKNYCLYHHYPLSAHHWQSSRIDLSEDLKLAFLLENNEPGALTFFYPHFLVRIFYFSGMPYVSLQIWNLKNHECLLNLEEERDRFYVGSYTILGDVFIFVGKEPESDTQLYCTLLGSHTLPQPLDIPIESRAKDVSFYLYQEKLVLQDGPFVSLWEFSIPQTTLIETDSKGRSGNLNPGDLSTHRQLP